MPELTPLEEAIISAQEVAAGLAAVALVHDLVNQDLVARATWLNTANPDDKRKKALAESRQINLMLSLIAEQRALFGVAA